MSTENQTAAPEPNPCGGYYCSEQHGHIDCQDRICRSCQNWDPDDLDCSGQKLPEAPIGFCPIVDHMTRPTDGKHCPAWLRSVPTL